MTLVGTADTGRAAAAMDFERRTLDRISSIVGRVSFIASLRDGSTYRHWGLARNYGEQEVSRVLSDAHTQCFLEVLRTGVPALRGHAEAAAESAGTNFAHYARQMWEGRGLMSPLAPEGGSLAHFDWILFVLWKIAERPNTSSGRGASPPPPLGR
jgi:hypothetical protein